MTINRSTAGYPKYLTILNLFLYRNLGDMYCVLGQILYDSLAVEEHNVCKIDFAYTKICFAIIIRHYWGTEYQLSRLDTQPLDSI